MDTPHPPPESVARLIGVALGWILFSLFTAIVAERAIPQLVPWIDPVGVRRMLGVGFVTLLVASAIRAKIVGNGNLQVGVGNYPIAAPALIIVLGIAEVAFVVTGIEVQYASHPDLFSDVPPLDLASPGSSAVLTINYIVLAPLAEELFFRGWLWTGLRKHLSPLSTAAITSVLWIGAHGNFSLGLIMHSVVLSFARHSGNSVRASFALHAIYIGSLLISTWLVANHLI
jgi:membrane protease YdiL (CAAX protease family)